MKVVVRVPDIVALAAVCQAYGLDLWPTRTIGKDLYKEIVRDYIGMNGESAVQDHLEEYAKWLPEAQLLKQKYFK